MPSILKPSVYRIALPAFVAVWLICGALNHWSFFGNSSTRASLIVLAATTVALGLSAVSVIASERVRGSVLREGVEFRSVRNRFLFAAGLFLILGAIEMLVAMRQVS
jgi:hypothetical protein